MNLVEVVVGYKIYVDLIKELLRDKKVISTGMRGEIERVNLALEHALNGQHTAIISSGDAGIYGMAGLVLEVCKERNIHVGWLSSSEDEVQEGGCDIRIEIVPGIPAFCAAASLLGAPLMHDFASISLSDLLTPWEIIIRRIEYAAKEDLLIVLYNPKSKERNWQLSAVKNILLRHRSPETSVGIVSKAMRKGERIEITNLARMDQFKIDMQTILIVGNSTSFQYRDFMVTPRGYMNKYSLKKKGL